MSRNYFFCLFGLFYNLSEHFLKIRNYYIVSLLFFCIPVRKKEWYFQIHKCNFAVVFHDRYFGKYGNTATVCLSKRENSKLVSNLAWFGFWSQRFSTRFKKMMRERTYISIRNSPEIVGARSYLAALSMVLPPRIGHSGQPQQILGHFLLSKSFWILSASSIIK